jgi:hypothetical protein
LRHIKAFSIDTGEEESNESLGIILSAVSGILIAIGNTLMAKENS